MLVLFGCNVNKVDLLFAYIMVVLLCNVRNKILLLIIIIICLFSWISSSCWRSYYFLPNCSWFAPKEEYKCWQWTFLQIFFLKCFKRCVLAHKKNIVRFRKISCFSLPDCRWRCSWKSSWRLGFFSWCCLKRWSLVLWPSRVISPLSSATSTIRET